MRFYTQQHKYYCGVDLHARSIYVCILNQEGAVLVHKNLRAKPDAFWSKIEKQFRASKSSNVGVTPFFHWTDGKIRCHLLSCVIALTVLRAGFQIDSPPPFQNHSPPCSPTCVTG